MLPPPRPTPDFDVDRGPPVHFALLTTLVALVAFAREGRREDARACARGQHLDSGLLGNQGAVVGIRYAKFFSSRRETSR
jgi:hypothetical protein